MNTATTATPTTTTTAATTALSAPLRKGLKKSSTAALIAAVLPEITFSDAEILKASVIRMNAATAAAAMGGKATPLSLVTAAIWMLAKAGHAKLEMGKDIPVPAQQFVKDAWAQCCATERPGKGFTAGNVRRAITHAIALAVARVPVKKEEKAPTLPPPASVALSTLDLTSAMADIAAHGAAMDNRAWENLEKYQATYAANVAAARLRAEVLEAEEVKARSLAENAYRALQAEISALRATLADVSKAKTIQEVKALLAASGFTLAA